MKVIGKTLHFEVMDMVRFHNITYTARQYIFICAKCIESCYIVICEALPSVPAQSVSGVQLKNLVSTSQVLIVSSGNSTLLF